MALDAVWYEIRPLGINSLAKVMKTISKDAHLSKIYTNHSVRATAITLQSNAEISNRHIIAISGHRSEQSLVSYNSQPSTSQLHNCSQVLSRAFSPSANNHRQQSETSQKSTSSLNQTSGNEIALQRMHYSKRANLFQRFILGIDLKFSPSCFK